jgi:mono/diheme cytochrome c family protein
MKKTTLYLFCAAMLGVAIYSCSDSAEPKEPETAAATASEAIKRGEFLVNVGGCNDCHTPKIMTEQGPALDMTKLLSGHQAGVPLAPYDSTIVGPWILMHPQLTAAVGPWGTSFAANLTPHETGLGAWAEENFVQAIKKGKHQGMDNQRPIMPPMPWQAMSVWPEEDIKAIFAYLKSIPPVENVVPAYMPPSGM